MSYESQTSGFRIQRYHRPRLESVSEIYSGGGEVEVHSVGIGDVCGHDTVVCYVVRIRGRFTRLWFQ